MTIKEWYRYQGQPKHYLWGFLHTWKWCQTIIPETQIGSINWHITVNEVFCHGKGIEIMLGKNIIVRWAYHGKIHYSMGKYFIRFFNIRLNDIL